MTTFKPMLAATLDLNTLTLPVLCTPKYDGIRCVIRDGVVLSRTLKPIPNLHVRTLLKECPDDLDGELIVPESSFNATQSAVMRVEGTPNVRYYVFDLIRDAPYEQRMKELESLPLPDVCVKVLPVRISTKTSLFAYEERCTREGYEGIMVRSPTGPYKYGRSTEKQGYLLKMKRFLDAEARIIDFEELMHNENEALVDERGYTKRSSHRDGKVPGDTLGCFLVETDDHRVFRVSTGLTAEQRQLYWDTRSDLLGKLVKYKYQESGAKDLPRFPVFLGFRSEDDM